MMENVVSVGIDVSKGNSMVCGMKFGGECVISPYKFTHTKDEFKQLVKSLKALEGDVRIVMEHTGIYYLPVAKVLFEAGFFVSVVHAKLIHDFGNNTIRKGKTDKKDSIKIANYGLSYWNDLIPVSTLTNQRDILKKFNRQLSLYRKTETSYKNNLISLLDTTFPGINSFFSGGTKANGHEKWIDFVEKYWHKECVTSLSLKAFSESYAAWCKKTKSQFSQETAKEIYAYAKKQVSSFPKDNDIKLMVQEAIKMLNRNLETVLEIQKKMKAMAEILPEFQVVKEMYGMGDVLAPQIIAEIGDVTRFHNKRALTAFAGLDAPPFQSGQMDLTQRKISKRGTPHLRRSLFLVMSILMLKQPEENETYQFMLKKRSEGKHYYVYMTAGANKFLRQYYGKVNEFLKENKDKKDSVTSD